MDLHLGAQLSPLLLPHLAAPRELCFRSLQLQGLRVLLCELLRLLLCLLPLRPRLLRLMLLPGLDLIQRHAGMRLLLLLLLLRLLLLLLLRVRLLLRLRLLLHLLHLLHLLLLLMGLQPSLRFRRRCLRRC